MVSFVTQRGLNPDAVSTLARHGCAFSSETPLVTSASY
jgi:hypothetical protein